MDYAWEKLYGAVLGMASSPQRLQERIANAYVWQLIHIRPEEQLPQDLRPLLEEIASAMRKQPAVADEGTALASARVMSDEEACDLAEKITSLYDQVSARRR